MSWNYWLYRAPENAGSPFEWEADLAEPIGSPDAVASTLEQLFPGLAWTDAARQHGQFEDAVYGAPTRISLIALNGDAVGMIWPDNRASPATIAQIMAAFGLNHCMTDYGERRFPTEVDADWKPRPGARQPEKL